jgi:hypothetical protein
MVCWSGSFGNFVFETHQQVPPEQATRKAQNFQKNPTSKP